MKSDDRDSKSATARPDLTGTPAAEMSMPQFPSGVDPETFMIDQVNALLKNTAYLSVFSRSDASRPNSPIMRATNPFGSLLLNSGVMPMVAAVGKVAGPQMLEWIAGAMPIDMIGV